MRMGEQRVPGLRTHAAVDLEPVRALERLDRREGMRAELPVDTLGIEPRRAEQPLQLRHRGAGRALLEQRPA